MTTSTRELPPTPPTQPAFGRTLATACGLLVLFTLLLGVAYPWLVTVVANVAFPDQATGSVIVEGGEVRGSRLVGQPFESPRYFWGRLSATAPFPYDAASSRGSNLGPTNAALTAAARARLDALRAADPESGGPVPVDLVTSSGSGLDPHISPAAAAYQVRRVARVRGLDEADVRALVAASTAPRWLGIFGEPRVNVLTLNLSLDRRAPR